MQFLEPAMLDRLPASSGYFGNRLPPSDVTTGELPEDDFDPTDRFSAACGPLIPGGKRAVEVFLAISLHDLSCAEGGRVLGRNRSTIVRRREKVLEELRELYPCYRVHEALRSKGGCTIDPQTGRIATEGFAVGLSGAQVRFFNLPSIGEIREYLRRWRLSDGETSNGLWLGGWYDGSEYEIDTSIVVGDRGRAIELGSIHGQAWIYDVKNRRPIKVETG